MRLLRLFVATLVVRYWYRLNNPLRTTSFLLVKHLLTLLCLVLLAAGCASSNTPEMRRAERAAAYAALPAEQRELVDHGQIKVGMSTDAVYIAWGKPAQILQSENERGGVTTWLYEGDWMKESRYWAYRQTGIGPDLFLERYLINDYQPRTYVSAQLRFVDGKLKEWQTLPRPPD